MLHNSKKKSIPLAHQKLYNQTNKQQQKNGNLRATNFVGNNVGKTWMQSQNEKTKICSARFFFILACSLPTLFTVFQMNSKTK